MKYISNELYIIKMNSEIENIKIFNLQYIIFTFLFSYTQLISKYDDNKILFHA